MRAHFPYLVLAAALLVFAACRKLEPTFPGDTDFDVRVTWTNDVTGPGTSELLPAQEVFVNDSNSVTEYLFSVVSDAFGTCRFEYLDDETEYVFFSSKLVDGLLFTGRTSPSTQVGVELALWPDTVTQNGFVISCFDPLGGKLTGLNVCVYGSKELALVGNCAAATFSGVTDGYGRFAKWNIGAQKWYVRVKSEILLIDRLDSMVVGQNGFVRPALTMDANSLNGFVITCVDDQGNGIPALEVCMYLSGLVAAEGDCAFATYAGVTDAFGKFSRSSVPPDMYFVNVQSDSLLVDVQDTLIVTPQSIATLSIEVLP